MAQKTITARVLVAFTLAGHDLQPNDVVSMTEKDFKAYAGFVDADLAAVEAGLLAGGRAVDVTKPKQADNPPDADEPQV